MSKIISPHDRFFRSAMKNHKVAVDFFDHYLPSTLREALNIETLHCLDTSYIDDDLSAVMSDLVFHCELSGHTAYISLLVEHQSSPDQRLPFRVHHYLFSLLHTHSKQPPETLLPPVYTLVFYHGRQTPYPYSLNLFDCFNDPLKIMPSIIGQPLNLVDINQLSDEQLAKQQWIGPLLTSLKHIREKNIQPYMIKVLSTLSWPLSDNDAKALLRLMLNYLLNSGNIERIDDIISVVEQVPKSIRGDLMTIAEQLKAQGREEGIQKGLSTGRQQGREQGIESVALRMLNEGAEPAFVAKMTGLTIERVIALLAG